MILGLFECKPQAAAMPRGARSEDEGQGSPCARPPEETSCPARASLQSTQSRRAQGTEKPKKLRREPSGRPGASQFCDPPSKQLGRFCFGTQCPSCRLDSQSLASPASPSSRRMSRRLSHQGRQCHVPREPEHGVAERQPHDALQVQLIAAVRGRGPTRPVKQCANETNCNCFVAKLQGCEAFHGRLNH